MPAEKLQHQGKDEENMPKGLTHYCLICVLLCGKGPKMQFQTLSPFFFSSVEVNALKSKKH
jgi:hypothetical protein